METEKIYRKEIERMKREVVEAGSNGTRISIPKLKMIENKKLLLFEILAEYGFNYTQTENIIGSLDNISGKLFHSETHTLVKDRKVLIIEKKEINDSEAGYIYPETSSVEIPVKLKITAIEKTTGFKINSDPSFAFLDKKMLRFPLKIRKWQYGDYFYPLGMKNRKKLSDFFIDEKLPVTEKQKTFVLTSDDKIVWVIGYRIDNRFKITEKTETVLQLELLAP